MAFFLFFQFLNKRNEIRAVWFLYAFLNDKNHEEIYIYVLKPEELSRSFIFLNHLLFLALKFYDRNFDVRSTCMCGSCVVRIWWVYMCVSDADDDVNQEQSQLAILDETGLSFSQTCFWPFRLSIKKKTLPIVSNSKQKRTFVMTRNLPTESNKLFWFTSLKDGR